jgi:hypothetical protein
MDKAYWLERERESMDHARAATLADEKNLHYELARGYRMKAADAEKGAR